MTGLNQRRTAKPVGVGLAALLVCGLHSSHAGAQDGLPYTIAPLEGSVEFGRSVASGGDVDGDGLPDIFVADAGYRSNSMRVGRWSIHSGRDGAMIWSAAGDTPDDLGWIVGAFIGDVDGDQRADIVVGAAGTRNGIRAIRVYSGIDGTMLYSVDAPGLYDLCAVGDVDGDLIPDFAHVDVDIMVSRLVIRSGANGSEILRVSPASDWFTRVRGGGDLNGDHVPDLLIGARNPGGSGPAFWMLAISGVTGRTLWETRHMNWSVGYAIATGTDVTGDGVWDIATMLHIGIDGVILNGANGRLLRTFSAAVPSNLWGVRLDFADVNGDGAVELLGLRWQEPRFGLDAIDCESRAIHWAEGMQGSNPILIWGYEAAVADLNGDGSDDFIIGSVGAGVSVFGGSPLLLNFAEMRDNYDLTRGQPYDFTVGGGRPGRTMHLLGSITGNGCTFIQRLGICIDLDQRIYNLGSAISDVERVARFTLDVPPLFPRGPVWLQAIDPADPARGAIKSNVMRLEVVD